MSILYKNARNVRFVLFRKNSFIASGNIRQNFEIGVEISFRMSFMEEFIAAVECKVFLVQFEHKICLLKLLYQNYKIFEDVCLSVCLSTEQFS